MFALKLTFLFVGLVAATDYCRTDLCDSGEKHIGCNNDGKFYSSCPKDAKIVHFNDDIKAYMLNAHNKLRSKIASGQQEGFPSSSQMATITWSHELAKLAELNVKQCTMNHDECRNTDQFPFAGQNLAFAARTNGFYSAKEMIDSGVESQWYGEISKATSDDIETCCENGSILHFTQLVWGKATEIGCSMSQFTEGQWKKSLLACNYAIGNVDSQSVYKIGNPADECTSENPDYSGLCAVGDPAIDPRS